MRLPSEQGQQQTFSAELRVDGQSLALGTLQVAELHKVGCWVGGWVELRASQQQSWGCSDGASQSSQLVP